MIPEAPAGATVYRHPQGKVIHVHPDGTMDTYKPDGKRASSSATPEKLAAGYGGWARVSGDDAPGPIPELAGTTTPVKSGPRIPMVFQELDIANATSLVNNDRIVVEQKLDGTRVLVIIQDGEVRFLGRNGQPLKHATAAQHFANLRPAFEMLMNPGVHTVLDGEIMQTGELWLFDCPQNNWGGAYVTPTDTLAHRRSALEIIARAVHKHNFNIRLTPQARTLEEKMALIKAIDDEGGEGVMLKHLDSTYDGGSRVKHSVKVKFVKTADVVVLHRDDKGKNNAQLGVWDPDGDVWAWGEKYRVVGNCSMIGKVDAQIGDVIEVAFLNWTGTKLYQPRMKQIRKDKERTDCRMDQFPDYSRKVITL